MNMGQVSLNAIYAAMPDARASLRIGGRSTIEKCVTAGLTFSRFDSDNGQVDSIQGNIRFVATDEPETRIAIGDVIEVTSASLPGWVKARVSGRHPIGGMVRLELQGEFEQ